MDWKIPEQFSICSVKLTVRFVKHLAADGSYLGRSHHYLNMVELDSDMSEQQKQHTFLHEWLHEVSVIFHLDLSEQQIYTISTATLQLTEQLVSEPATSGLPTEHFLQL